MRSRRDGEYALMPCMTCKSFDTKIKHDTVTGTPVAGGCHGCGIIYYGQVVFCALHDEIGSPPKDYRYFENARKEFAKKYPVHADHRIFHIGIRDIENGR